MLDMARAMGVANPTSPMDFVDALVALRKACGVDNIKMSDYGITREDLPEILKFSRLVGQGMYDGDCYTLSDDDVMWILKESYK
jgi:alcohol dehydrogenase